ncbi:hypothetical protein MPSEU_000226000 [Mayamaea pseudoterrestris]|nr:hypothetical protein MPSEU_000226000 [Mayamaea pseudoterrestris]
MLRHDNMIPPRQRKISRELWDQANTSHGALARAILYELQPFRLRELHQWCARMQGIAIALVAGCKRLLLNSYHWMRNDLSLWHVKVFAGVLLYYCFVRLVHAHLDAGPVVLIVTVLALIFTIGLNDEKDPQRQMSAYHVFNRGMQRMMGDVDAEQLLAQHVGGVFYHNGGVNRHDNHEHDDVRAAFRNQPAAAPVENVEEHNAAAPPQGTARRSRKKARGEQRRDIQRQREAAAAIDEDDENAVAVQRLIEEQIRNEQQ